MQIVVQQMQLIGGCRSTNWRCVREWSILFGQYCMIVWWQMRVELAWD